MGQPWNQGHVIHFWSDKSRLAEVIAVFAADGLDCGERVVLIVSPERWSDCRPLLQERGVDTDKLIKEDRLIVLALEETLASLLPAGRFDRSRFGEFLARIMSAIRPLKEVRVYGELVNLLAERDDWSNAAALEAAWDEAADRSSLCVMLSYSERFRERRRRAPN